ncbi:FtsX-like permease family protein [[Acholeplasma] multilocale]|uniref:FtsX-like permease family protein n=1 Tax=[Acholeplasma] multilocale TaxID=264638 RepID=UPI00047C95F1|nr:FtsX-like permease family protein [[Acholeplasma] multilocale]
MLNNSIFKQMRFYAKYNLATAFAFLISSTFIVSTFFLLLSSSSIKNYEESNMGLIFIILSGLTFIVCSLLSLSIMKVNLEVRRSELNNKRLLGFSHKKIFSDLLREQLLILIPIFILGFILAIPLNNFLIAKLQDKEILDQTFKLNMGVVNSIITILAGFVFLIGVVFISTRGYKSLFVSNINSANIRTKTLVFKLIVGIGFLAGYLALTIFTDSEVVYLFGGLFLAIAVFIMGDILIMWLMDLLTLIFFKSYLMKIIFANIKNNIKKIVPIIFIVVLSFVLLNFNVNVIGAMSGVSAYESSNNKYAEGFNFLGVYLNLIIISYGLLMVINGLSMYLHSMKRSNNDLRILGYTNTKIFMRNITENVVILVIALILGFSGSTAIALAFDDQENLKNWLVWVYAYSSLVLIFLSIPTITYFSSAIRTNKKPS